jgi:hypothetical protein
LPSVVSASKSGAVSLIARVITHLRPMAVIYLGRQYYSELQTQQPVLAR